MDVTVRVRPAHDVSGDVYDFFEQDGEWNVITFGDVSGKGAAAALYGALVNGLLRTLAPNRRSPADLLQKLNEALGERKVTAVYLTLQVLFWQAKAKTLSIANAGVFPPIICRDGEILKQRVEGIPLGLLDNRRAAAYPGVLDNEAFPAITLSTAAVEVDDQIITSRGPGTAMDFALTLIEQLCGLKKRQQVSAQLQR